MTRTAEYKGRHYLVLYMGRTKFGCRAKLAYVDGSKEFWCNASDVVVLDSQERRSTRRPSQEPVCRTCRGIHDGGTICPDCGQED